MLFSHLHYGNSGVIAFLIHLQGREITAISLTPQHHSTFRVTAWWFSQVNIRLQENTNFDPGGRILTTEQVFSN